MNNQEATPAAGWADMTPWSELTPDERRARNRAVMRGEFAHIYLARPLEHDCDAQEGDVEPTAFFTTEHRRRAETSCEFARQCFRAYQQERLARRAAEDASAADDDEDGAVEIEEVDDRRWAIYRIGFVGRPEFYIGLADDVYQRFNQHMRRSSSPAVRAMMDDGARPQLTVLMDGIKTLDRARGAEEFAIRCGKFGAPDQCLNRQHNGR